MRSGTPGIVIALPYVRFFNTGPSATSCIFRGSSPFDISTRQALNGLIDELNSALRTVAIGAGIQLLDSDALQTTSNGHRFCESSLGTNLWFQGILASDSSLDNALDNNRSLSDDEWTRLQYVNEPGFSAGGGTFQPNVAGHTAYEQVLKAQVVAQNPHKTPNHRTRM